MITYGKIFTNTGAVLAIIVAVACFFAAQHISNTRWEKSNQLEKDCVAFFSKQIPRLLASRTEDTHESLTEEIEGQLCAVYKIEDVARERLSVEQIRMIDHANSYDWSNPVSTAGGVAFFYFFLWLLPVSWRFLLARIVDLRKAIIGR